jgi:hypothetical protein
MKKLLSILVLFLVMLSVVIAVPTKTMVYGTVTTGGTPVNMANVVIVCQHNNTYYTKSTTTATNGMYIKLYNLNQCTLGDKVFAFSFLGNLFGFANPAIVNGSTTSAAYYVYANIGLN